jgi:hypothetical protein
MKGAARGDIGGFYGIPANAGYPNVLLAPSIRSSETTDFPKTADRL